MVVIVFLVNLITLLSLSLAKDVNIPLLYDYPSEMIFSIAKIGTNGTSFFYPLSISSKFSVFYSFGKENIDSSTLIVTQNLVYQSSNNLTGVLATDYLSFGEHICEGFQFVYNSDENPVNWRTFRGILSFSRSQYAFHHQLYEKGLISQKVIEFNDHAALRVGEYNTSRSFGSCNAIANEDYWSCTINGFIMGEILGRNKKVIHTDSYRHFHKLTGLVSFHSMEKDIIAPFEYLEWFKVNYFGMDSKGELNDKCNEFEDEDSLGNVIFKIACYDKPENTYVSVSFFIGEDLVMTIPDKEIFDIVDLQDKEVKVFRIQFKEKAKEWHFGWRILKSNNVILNDDNSTISMLLGENVFNAALQYHVGFKYSVITLACSVSVISLLGVLLLVFFKSTTIGKDYNNLITLSA